MDFPRKRLVEMVKKYVHFRRVKDIQETVRRLKMDSNVNERVLLSLKDIEDRIIQVIKKIIILLVFIQNLNSVNIFLSFSLKRSFSFANTPT